MECRCQDGGLFAHHSRDITAENNIFALNHAAQVAVGDYGSAKSGRDVCAFDDNLYWNSSGKAVTFGKKNLTEWQAMGQDKNSLVADPLFVDAVKGNFKLSERNPATQIGFEPWDFSKVGPRPASPTPK